MTQALLEHHKAWESLGGAARSVAPRPSSSCVSHQNLTAAQLGSDQGRGQQLSVQYQSFQPQSQHQPQNSLQRRPVPYRQYPKAELSRRAHANSNRVSAPPAPNPAHNANTVPSVLAAGQPCQQQHQQQQHQQQQHQQQQQARSLQPQPSQYRHSLHPQALMPSYQHQENQQQHSRYGSQPGSADWTGAASRLSAASTNTAASRLSTLSDLTAPSTAPSTTLSSEHLPVPCSGFGYEESPLARLQSQLPNASASTTAVSGNVPELGGGGELRASLPTNRASMVATPTHDPSLCPEPLRVPRRPISMGATTPHRPELHISTLALAPTSTKVEMVRAAGISAPGTSITPSSGDMCTYRSDDYEDYMSPVLAAERRERGSSSSNESSVQGSEFDLDLNEMLRAEAELKLGLMSMGPIHSVLESGGKLSADVAANPMSTTVWQQWREYLGEGMDDYE